MHVTDDHNRPLKCCVINGMPYSVGVIFNSVVVHIVQICFFFVLKIRNTTINDLAVDMIINLVSQLVIIATFGSDD